MKVIITEKPSVAKDISKVLNVTKKCDGYFEGSGYFITWAFGHLVQLVNPDAYDPSYKQWTMDLLPIIPETFKTEAVNDSGVKRQLSIIMSLLNKDSVKGVVCATDAGREGELIFRHIYDKANCDKPIQRLWISSQTDQAIKEGFSSLKPGEAYQPLYDSALSRSEADWLIGMNASRAYTIRYSNGQGVMSIGRVQTPVLKMLVDRYQDNINFKPTTYYEVMADIHHAKGVFKAKWFQKKEDRILEKPVAEKIMLDMEAYPQCLIKKVTHKERKEKQPLLYDLTEIQKDANKRFKFSAEKTLSLMQSLYEKHKVVTYPRTSSRYLSKDLVPKLKERLENAAQLAPYKSISEKILSKKIRTSKRFVDDKKVTDHHAIIPTEKKADLDRLSVDEKAIFDLVMKRFLSVFLPECVKSQTDIISLFGKHTFKSNGTVIKLAGWREVYQDQVEEGAESLLPDVQDKDPVTHQSLQLREGQTKAPPLYNEASILAAMETAGRAIEDEEMREAMKDCGLGTPSTRAQIIERLIKVGYVERQKNKLVPTSKGCYLISNIQDKALLSAELTGAWEKKLNDMSKNSYNRVGYMKEIREFTINMVESLKQADLKVNVPEEDSLGACPKCDNAVVETASTYQCSNWRMTKCPFTIWKTIAGKVLTKEEAVTLLTEKRVGPLEGFKSKAGKSFRALLTFDDDDKVIFGFNRSLGECPLCKGSVVESPKAYSCSQWRDTGCTFTIWKSIASRPLIEGEVMELIAKGKVTGLKGFKSRAGKLFDANLILKEGKAVFDFS